MGQKVNYNSKKSKKLKKIVFIILTIILCIIVIKTLITTMNQLKEQNNPTNENNDNSIKYSVEDYSSLEALLNNYNCELKSQKKSGGTLILDVSFSVNLYDGEESNERYFDNICKAVAAYIKYENFELIDNSKKIDIEVKCEESYIVEIKINDDVNYYLNHDSEINSKKLNNRITNFTIQSKELQELIDNNWDETKVNWGTKDSTCDDYNIYFDEGIKYKVVARNIFNVIFTSKYNGQIAGTLNANSSNGEVINALGEPTFKEGDSLYGYLSDNNYLFFDFLNKEVSIYPIVEISQTEEEQLKNFIDQMNKSLDVKQFSTDLLTMWSDYDVYDYDSNYVDLRYTLKGFQLDISGNSLKNGIFIYSNYSGNIDINELDNVYLKGDDFVFIQEKERARNENLQRNIQGEFSEEELKQLGIKFSVNFNRVDEDIYIGPIFYSRDEEYADTELDKSLEVSSYKWFDEYNWIYSVNDDGIYVYNCANKNKGD